MIIYEYGGEALQEKYKQKWRPICPATGQNKLLWMIGEVGEVIRS